MKRRARRRLVLLIGAAAALWVIVALGVVIGTGSGDGKDRAATRSLPEAGGRGAGSNRSLGLDPLGAVAREVERVAPELLDPPVRGPAAPRSVRDLAERLPPSRQVAQLMLVSLPGRGAAGPLARALRRRDFGGALLSQDNYESAQQLAALTSALRAQARRARRVPPLIAAAQEGGERSAFGDLPPESQPEQAVDGTRGVRAAARTAGRQLRLLGLSLQLAPVADVPAPAGPLVDRAFSDDAPTVAALAAAAVQGYRDAKLAAAPSHFPGEGAASQDPSVGPATVGLSLDELRVRDLRALRAALAHAPAVVVSEAVYAAYDGVTPAALLPEVASRLLRDEVRFRGAAIADDIAAAADAAGLSPGEAAVQAVRAGCDLVLVPGGAADVEDVYTALLSAVRSGELPRARVREALLRALQLKVAAGLIRAR